MAAAITGSPPRTAYVGRSFVHPLFDVLLIGGGLTFPLLAWLWWDGRSAAAILGLSLPALLLLVNQAHFAASTVRLYTKPGTFEELPRLTMVFPLVTLLVLSIFIAFADDIGQHLWALYLTWSPFHYAAQTFGLASMYCYRSGLSLTRNERLMLRWSCLMPFFTAFLSEAPMGHGLGWFVPVAALSASPLLLEIYQGTTQVLGVLTFALPAALFGWLAYLSRSGSAGGSPRPGFPLISLVLVVSNGIWWVVLSYVNAFVWATIFHGLQYLAIVSIFHVRDRMPRPGNRRGPLFHVLTLYAMCVGLGYLLFQCWPLAYVTMGFGRTESFAMIVAVINVHHFVVDAFIWRIRKDRNYATVMAGRS